MNLLLFPGNSESNKEWIKQVASELSELFEELHIQKYSHWKTEEELIDFSKELKKVKRIKLNNYCIFC